MALRQKLTRPFVVEPTADHSYTVVFLHRFPEATSDDELPEKVLSAKLTKNHKTLREQFPSVRWVFPYPKAHARHWSNLSAADRAAVGLSGNLPYITQVILQEANQAGSLDRVILGGQGETAIAAHEAMTLFPKVPAAMSDKPDEIAAYLHKTFFKQSWTDITQLQLAGYVGMHAADGVTTRDVTTYSIISKEAGPANVNSCIVKNTPHKFIHGGYKQQTITWDGRRIDDFAAFLVDIGVPRAGAENSSRALTGVELSTEIDRRNKQKKAEEKSELTENQKYAQEIVKQKKEQEKLRDKIMVRIEADKVERKIRQERTREARKSAAEAAKVKAEKAASKPPKADPSTLQLGEASSARPMFASYQPMLPPAPEDTPLSDDDAEVSDYDRESSRSPWEEGEYPPDFNGYDENDGDAESDWRPKKRMRKIPPGRRADEGATWAEPSQVKGQMSEAQLRALGLAEGPKVKKEDET